MKRMSMVVSRIRLAQLSVWIALLTFLGALVAHAESAIELAWDPNSESDLAGYRVYSGTVSGSHALLADVGNVTSTTVTNLQEGSTVYFVVTAYNTSNLESPPSVEVSYTVPVNVITNITPNDTTAPVLTCPPSLIVSATSASGAVVTYSVPTATDAVDANPTVTSIPASGSVFPIGTTTVTCTATDASGNSANCVFSVTVKDTAAPVLVCPPDTMVSATSASGAIVTYPAPTATDAVDPKPTVTSIPASGSTFPIGTTTVTCTATDASGNRSSGSFIVTVNDTTAPVLTCPANMTVEATSASGAVVSYPAPTATDSLDIKPTVTSTPASGSLFPVGITTVTCTATGATGKTSSGSFTVTVKDSTAPVLTCPANMTVAATSASGAVVTYSGPTAKDAVDPKPTVTSIPASGSTFPIGTTTVTCTATDASGNRSSGSFIVTVNDTTAPVLTCPANMTVEATSASGAVVSYPAPTATDSLDIKPTVTSTPASGSLFPIGTTTVTCTATGATGKTSSGSFTVTVKDSTAPVLIIPANITVAATSADGAVVTYSAPTATDTVDSSPSVSSTPASGSLFPIGTTPVTCTAIDASGNTASRTFTITVSPLAVPTLAESVNTPAWNWRTGGKTMWFPQTSVARDGSAAAQSGSIPVKQSSWMETALTGPGVLRFWWKVSSEADKDFLRLYVGSVEQTRISGEVDWVEVSVNIPSGSQPVRWSYTKDDRNAAGQDAAWVDLVSFSAPTPVVIDGGSSNTNNGSSTGPIADTTAPVLTCPANLTVAATSAGGAVVTYAAPTATDAMDPSPTVTSTPPSGSTFPVGTTTVTCTATDASGNTASGSFTVTVTPMPLVAPTLAESVNTPGMRWRTGGKDMWFAQTAVTHDGFAAGQSGAISSKQSTWMETALTGPGVLRFWWKVSSEADKDFLRLYVGSVEQTRISGEVDWVQVSVNIPPGAQPVRWSYTKDAADVIDARGQDAAWLDQVSFSTTSLATIASAEPVLRNLSASPLSSTPSAQFVTQLDHVEEGSVRVIAWGPAGETCQLQASENLIDWTIIANGPIDQDGEIHFLDPLATETAPRFYRALSVGNDR